MRVLVIDVGGSHVKLLASGRRAPLKLDSGPDLGAAQMVRAVKKATEGWAYDVVSIGYPGPVVYGRPLAEPVNLGPGWVRYDFERHEVTVKDRGDSESGPESGEEHPAALVAA